MWLGSLNVERVRNLVNIQIKPTDRVNIIHGNNASGKTAILESICLLSKARSFRTPFIKEVIQHNQADLIVSGKLNNRDDQLINTAIRKSGNKTEIKYDGKQVKTVSKQARNLVVQTVVPDNMMIINGSPKERRKWLDWAMFHMEQDYLEVWHSYHQALRNRNALLRRLAGPQEFLAWEDIMATTAQLIESKRSSYLLRLHKLYQQVASDLACDVAEFGIREEGKHFLEYLRSARKADMKAGFTQKGPHKADLEIRINGRLVKTVLSRGQAKLLVAVLSVAQARFLEKETNIRPIMLVDDLASELDGKAVTMLLELLYSEAMQLFITTTDPNLLTYAGLEANLFHVERGSVNSC